MANKTNISPHLVFAVPAGKSVGSERLQDLDATPGGFYAGVILQNGKKDDGSFVVTSLPIEGSLPPASSSDEDTREEIKLSIASVVDVIGFIITDKYDIGVELTALGIFTGNFYGNAKDGLVIQLDLLLLTGTVKFYLKDGELASSAKQLWISYNLSSKIFVKTTATGDEKILDL